jgi:hypothetical protein
VNTVPLNILVDALAALDMLRKVADEHLTTDQYMQALRAGSILRVYVNHISEQIKVEVPA